MNNETDLVSEINLLHMEPLDVDFGGSSSTRNHQISPLPLSRLHSPVKAMRSSSHSVKSPLPNAVELPIYSPIGSHTRPLTGNGSCPGPIFTSSFQPATFFPEAIGQLPVSPRSSFSLVKEGPSPPSPPSSSPPFSPVQLSRKGPVDSSSPISRLKYKDFVTQLKQLSSLPLSHCLSEGESMVTDLPTKVQWKAYLELGEVARRKGDQASAAQFIAMACRLNPQTPQPWLELCRLYEDFGDYENGIMVLNRSLSKDCCGYCEPIVLKLIKLNERFQNFDQVRLLLSMLRNESPGKSWRILSEGAQFEARRGNIGVCRAVLKFLIKNVPQQGPLYLDALRIELRHGQLSRMVDLLVSGLKQLPRYGPLWFQALRNAEFIYNFSVFQSFLNLVNGSLSEVVLKIVELAKISICPELTWKLLCEAAQLLSLLDCPSDARSLLAQAASCCSPSLLWKVWHVGARVEARLGRKDSAVLLMERALNESPARSTTSLVLDLCKVYELFGEYSECEKFFNDDKLLERDWKISLDAVMFLLRVGKTLAASQLVESCLSLHPTTGRLWALYMQLNFHLGGKKQLEIFYRGREIVPKSGELWCDAARVRLGPLSSRFSLSLAKKYLMVAAEFTPQYGDTFIELIRLRLLRRGLGADTEDIEKLCVSADPNYGLLWEFVRESPLEPVQFVFKRAKALIIHELVSNSQHYQRAIVNSLSATRRNQNDCDLGSNHQSSRVMGTGLGVFNSFVIGFSLRVDSLAAKFKVIFGDFVCP
ncbi:hypothetical protein P9112_004493 [Eukaryota sp. TZLM1-RC]